MASQERLIGAFMELVDTIVEGFDVMDFLHTLIRTSVEVLNVSASSVMLADGEWATAAA